MVQENIAKYIPIIENLINDLKALNPEYKFDKLDEFQQLKSLLYSNEWPEAINPNLIADINDSEQQMDRAEGIVQAFLRKDVKNRKVLDYGTGKGFLVNALSQYGANPFGYDIENQWDNYNHQGVLTTQWDTIKSNAPFDLIVLYDVLDHVIEETPVQVLQKIKQVLSPNGRIFIRNHPWCSKTGGHLYHEINKAFIHIIFSEEELLTLGYDPPPVEKLTNPIMTYKSWFNESNLSVEELQEIVKEKIDPFFIENQVISNRIKAYWNSEDKFPFQLSLHFIDYVATIP